MTKKVPHPDPNLNPHANPYPHPNPNPTNSRLQGDEEVPPGAPQAPFLSLPCEANVHPIVDPSRDLALGEPGGVGVPP